MKKHIIIPKIVLLATAVILLVSQVRAQFEQKVTMNFSVGSINPIGVNDYVYHNIYTTSNGTKYNDTWLYPYVFSNYKNGFSFTGGLQFNINRYFSLGVGIGWEKIGSWAYKDEYNYTSSSTGTTSRISRDFLSWTIYDTISTSTVVQKGTNDLKLNNFSIGVFPRLNLLYGKRINPYVFTQITFNYTDINYVNDRKAAYVKLNRLDEYNSKLSANLRNSFQNTPQNSFGIGLYSGIGFDISLNQNMGFYLQGGYSYISINKSDLKKANLEPENFKNIKVEVGVKISFLKSKDI